MISLKFVLHCMFMLVQECLSDTVWLRHHFDSNFYLYFDATVFVLFSLQPGPKHAWAQPESHISSKIAICDAKLAAWCSRWEASARCKSNNLHGGSFAGGNLDLKLQEQNYLHWGSFAGANHLAAFWQRQQLLKQFERFDNLLSC